MERMTINDTVEEKDLLTLLNEAIKNQSFNILSYILEDNKHRLNEKQLIKWINDLDWKLISVSGIKIISLIIKQAKTYKCFIDKGKLTKTAFEKENILLIQFLIKENLLKYKVIDEFKLLQKYIDEENIIMIKFLKETFFQDCNLLQLTEQVEKTKNNEIIEILSKNMKKRKRTQQQEYKIECFIEENY